MQSNDPDQPFIRPADEFRRRALTNRQRRKLYKQMVKRRKVERRTGDRQERMVQAMVAMYLDGWRKSPEPPSPNVAKFLVRVRARVKRRGRIDLRLMDRRFWELLFVCGWRPTARDPGYWPDKWQSCRVQIRAWSNVDYSYGYGVGQPQKMVPAASLYDWWITLHVQERADIMSLSRTLYDGKDAFSKRKRRNEKSRNSI